MRIHEAKIGSLHGSPVLLIDGRPVSMLTYSEGVGLSQERHRQFSDIGVEVFELSGQNLPAGAAPEELYQRGIAPHDYCIVGEKCGIDMSLCWTGPNAYDYTWVDRSIDEALQGAPKAYIIPRVWVEPPGWWLDAHPEELQQYADGFQGSDPGPGGARRVSFASRRWLAEAGEALGCFVEHIQERYPRHIIGYHFGAGLWGEWHYNCSHHMPDTSEPMRLAFGAYAREKYGQDLARLRKAWRDPEVTFESMQTPGEAERCRQDLGLFRDPVTSQRIIDYYHCHHHVLSEAVLNFAQAVKEKSENRSLVVIFFGYTRDIGFLHEGGHLDLKRILESPYIDCLSSPHSYRQRYAGLDGGFRALTGSIRLHGKGFFDEQDELTHIFKLKTLSSSTIYYGGYPPRSRYETIQLVRRQFAHTLTEGLGAWWFGCMIEDRWNDPEIISSFKEFMRIDKEALGRPRGRASEAAVFASPRSAYYTAHWKTGEHRITDALLNEQWSELFCMGAPFDIYDLDDIGSVCASGQYKCYIFLNAFYTDAVTREVIESLKRDGKTLVWFHAPGALNERINDGKPTMIQLSENATALTGIELRVEPRTTTCVVTLVDSASPWSRGLTPGMRWGIKGEYMPAVSVADPEVEILAEVDRGALPETDGRSGWVVKRMPDWTSVHFLAPTVPSPVLRNVLREAGCHIYLQSDDNLYLNQSYLGIHAVRAGRKKIELPAPCRIANLFDPAGPVAEGKTLELELKRFETALFALDRI